MPSFFAFILVEIIELHSSFSENAVMVIHGDNAMSSENIRLG